MTSPNFYLASRVQEYRREPNSPVRLPILPEVEDLDMTGRNAGYFNRWSPYTTVPICDYQMVQDMIIPVRMMDMVYPDSPS